MKCSVCANDIPEGSRFCGVCGQPVSVETEFESVRGHWNAVAEKTKEYETKRAEEAARIRKHARRIRVRWVLMAVIAVALVGWLTMTAHGKSVAQDAKLYANAWWAMYHNDYHRADELLNEMNGEFLNSWDCRQTCQEKFREERYYQARSCFSSGDFEGALILYRELGDYRDAPQWAESCLEVIRQRLEAPVLKWTFDEGPEGSDGTGWKGNAEWKRIVDSQVTHGLYFDGSDQMKLRNNVTVTGDWTVTVLVTSLSQENVQVLSLRDYREEAPVQGRLVIRNGRFVWEVQSATDSCTLESGAAVETGSCWYYVAVTKQDHTWYLYVDGVLQGWASCADSAMTDSQAELCLGKWDKTTEAETEDVPFLGYVAELEIYGNTFSEIEMAMVYEPEAYNAKHLWDTSFYFLAEDQPAQDHFIFLQTESYGDHMCLAMLHMADTDEYLALQWHKDYQTLEFLSPAAVAYYDLYYLDGETWVYVTTCEGFEAIYGVTGVTSSDLLIYGEGDQQILPVIVGGRG